MGIVLLICSVKLSSGISHLVSTVGSGLGVGEGTRVTVEVAVGSRVGVTIAALVSSRSAVGTDAHPANRTSIMMIERMGRLFFMSLPCIICVNLELPRFEKLYLRNIGFDLSQLIVPFFMLVFSGVVSG